MATLNKEGYSGQVITNKPKISASNMLAILKKTLETGTMKDGARSGCSHSTPTRQDLLLYYRSLYN